MINGSSAGSLAVCGSLRPWRCDRATVRAPTVEITSGGQRWFLPAAARHAEARLEVLNGWRPPLRRLVAKAREGKSIILVDDEDHDGAIPLRLIIPLADRTDME
jgi:hypothetical protein